MTIELLEEKKKKSRAWEEREKARRKATKIVVYMHEVETDAENLKRHKKLCIHLVCLCVGTFVTSLLSAEAMLVFCATGFFGSLQELLDFITRV